MADLNFIGSSKQITQSDIEALEKRLNTSLPSSYRIFVLDVNGGRPNKIFFTKDGSEYVLNEFFPLFEGEMSFEGQFKDLKLDRNVLPKQLAAIADDAFGNLICISLSGDNKGGIYFWDHENYDDMPSMGSARFLAIDIDHFLQMLMENLGQ